MQLSNNFTLAELVESPTARRLKITEQFTPSQEVVQNLEQLCKHILQPLRNSLKLPVVVTSGYRCAAVNKAVGGVATSQHLKGQAADIQCPQLSNAALYEKIKSLNLPFDQLIWEYGTKKEPAWVHVSWKLPPRRMAFSIGV